MIQRFGKLCIGCYSLDTSNRIEIRYQKAVLMPPNKVFTPPETFIQQKKQFPLDTSIVEYLYEFAKRLAYCDHFCCEWWP